MHLTHGMQGPTETSKGIDAMGLLLQVSNPPAF